MRVALVVGCLLLAVSSAFGFVSTNLTSQTGGPTQLQSSIGGMTFGFIKVGSDEVGTLAWHPDLKFGPWGLGMDVNLSTNSSQTPPNYENVVIRYAKYDDSQKGLTYGILDGVTYGRGLILNSFTTRLGSTVMLNNEQTGILGYYDAEKYVVRAMGTRSNIYAARIEDRVTPMLTISGYGVTDRTGRSIRQSDGTIRTFPAVSAVGADAIMPLPANFQAFAETGTLLNHGGGLAAGLSWAAEMMVANASFSAEYRMLDKAFIPGYFNVDYNNNPVDLASAEATGKAKNGYLVQLGINALGLATFNGALETYADSNTTLMADLSAKLSDQVNVKGYYKQANFADFRSISLEQGAILGADVIYKVNPLSSLILHYKKAYNPATGQVESTQYYEVGLNF